MQKSGEGRKNYTAKIKVILNVKMKCKKEHSFTGIRLYTGYVLFIFIMTIFNKKCQSYKTVKIVTWHENKHIVDAGSS